MDRLVSIRDVLQAYSLGPAPSAIVPIDSEGGFSGARLWRVAAGTHAFCLRQWPSEHPSLERLEMMHAVLRDVTAQGLDFVPAPMPTRSGFTYLRYHGQFWQLEPWLPGRNDYRRNPSQQRLSAALTALAQFHQAAARCAIQPAHRGPCPGVLDRLRLCERLRNGEYEQLVTAVKATNDDVLRCRAERLLRHFRQHSTILEKQLAVVARIPVPLQPCIRDIWHEHILFQNAQVTGIVDYGAMRTDSVAIDISRLLGSLAKEDDQLWRTGLDAYQTHRPLRADEQQMLPILNRSTLALSGMNWLRWICLERREFPDWGRVFRRIDEILEDIGSL